MERKVRLAGKTCGSGGNCTGFNGHWTADPGLPGIVNDWVTDITDYMRQPVDLSHPATSTLGYSNKLFLMSYTPAFPASDTAQLLPFTNPNVDLIDIHHGLQSREDLRNYFDQDQDFRDNYLSNGQKKPFHNGEFNYYSFIDVPFQPNDYETPKIFDNYDVSFHNEIWASTFFGNFAAGTTWEWERVFWWPYGMRTPPADNFPGGNQWQIGPFSSVLGDTNLLDIGVTGGYPVVNKPVYHNFKPLSDFLTNPNLQPYDFFNGDFSSHKVYDEPSELECYYLLNADQTMAIGWVHNLDAYWENHFYVTRAIQDYLGCTAPNAQSIALTGLQPGVDYHITWFPTRMNDTIHPADAVDTTETGTVLLDMSTAPLGDTLDHYLDTLRLDYAFIVALQPVHRDMPVAGEVDSVAIVSDWIFNMFPNPAGNAVTLVLPPDGAMREVSIYDLTGKRVLSRTHVADPLLQIPTVGLGRGAYCVRVSDAMSSKMKTLILR